LTQAKGNDNAIRVWPFNFKYDKLSNRHDASCFIVGAIEMSRGNELSHDN